MNTPKRERSYCAAVTAINVIAVGVLAAMAIGLAKKKRNDEEALGVAYNNGWDDHVLLEKLKEQLEM